MKHPKILLIENFASDFYSSRLPYAIFLKDKGYSVFAMVPSGTPYSTLIKDAGIEVIEFDLNRKTMGIGRILILSYKLRRVIRQNQFDIVHSFRFQPNILNTISGLGVKYKKIIHVTGLGIAFSNLKLKNLIIRVLSQLIFLFISILNTKIIVQNADDANDIIAFKIFKKKVKIILGSGVDTKTYNSNKFNRSKIRESLSLGENQQVFICVTRLIWEKGILELVQAFSKLSSEIPNILLLIVGWPDKDNPSHIGESFISSFKGNRNIKFLGKRDDIPHLLAASDVFVYPSYYREGIPRAILEALAIGLPIITTNTPGCNVAVRHLKNGILIKPKSSSSIYKAVLEVNNHDFKKLGFESRRMATNLFDNAIIFKQIEYSYGHGL